jgi:hypothetical protein
MTESHCHLADMPRDNAASRIVSSCSWHTIPAVAFSLPKILVRCGLRVPGLFKGRMVDL